MRGYKYIGYIRNPLNNKRWSCYLRGETAYMYSIDEEEKPIEMVRKFKSKTEIKDYIKENRYVAFLTIFA